METALVIAAIVGGTASGITKVIGGIALWNRFFKKPKLELYTEVTQEVAKEMVLTEKMKNWLQEISEK